MSRKGWYALDLMEGYVKFSDGHYELPLLWHLDAPCLPQNRKLSLRHLNQRFLNYRSRKLNCLVLIIFAFLFSLCDCFITV